MTNRGFDDQARAMAQEAAIPSLQVAAYPDPFDLETDAQLQEKSARIVVPQIIDALTKPIPVPTGAAEKRKPRTSYSRAPLIRSTGTSRKRAGATDCQSLRRQERGSMSS